MAVGLNWGEARKKQKASSGGGKGGNRRFIIKDGETVAIRFIGGSNEPYVSKRHSYKKGTGKMFGYMTCAEDAQREGKHAGCVACYMARQQGKNGPVKRANVVLSFSILDPRKFHKLDEEVTVRDDNGERYQTKYPPCRGDDCKWCARDNEAIAQGERFWTLPGRVSDQLREFEQKSLRRKCAACGVGKVTVLGYKCPECGTEMDKPDDPNEEQKCFECSTEKKPVFVLPKPIVECSRGCKKPRPCTLTDAWIEVTRSGSKTDTTYNFSVGDIGPLEGEEYENVKPLDFNKIEDFQPADPATQAMELGVRNPFGKAGEDEDDEDDPRPKRKKKSSLFDSDEDDEDDGILG